MVRATLRMRSWARARESLLLHGALEQAFGIGPEFAVGADLPGGHLGVGVDFFAGLLEAARAADRGRP